MPVKVWKDENNFYADMLGTGWGVLYAFPIKELASGASLNRMFNERNRELIQANASVVSKAEVREVSREAKAKLRSIIEPYFEARGYNG